MIDSLWWVSLWLFLIWVAIPGGVTAAVHRLTEQVKRIADHLEKKA